jgi:hypothetical protein
VLFYAFAVRYARTAKHCSPVVRATEMEMGGSPTALDAIVMSRESGEGVELHAANPRH